MSDSEEETVQVELAEWAQIQRKTFTRWCNTQLKSRHLEIEDLQVGLKDGVMLVNLVELLTQQPSPTRYNKKPRIKAQMVENIGIGLKILTDDGIKLVNIGNEDIYAGNMKLILGLIWTLILHYQISMDFGGDGGDSNKDVSAKKQLMNWASDLINNLPSGRSIKNFTTDWNDGMALCSMVEAVAPGLCPEHTSLDPSNRLENARLGLDRAEKGLGVPKILEAEDLINPHIDELSVLTYVSLLKNATPTIDLVPSDPLKVRIYGPGTETAWVDTPTQFFIDTSAAGFGKLDVEVKDCDGNTVPMELWKKDNETKVQYTPAIPGPLKFHVTYNKNDVPNGNFTVKVLAPTDSSKIRISGDGLKRAVVNKPASFVVDVSDAGVGELGVTIVGPGGKLPVDVVPGAEESLYHYTPDRAGPVLITVKYSGNEVPGCPFHVDVIDDIDPLKIRILTKGLEGPVVGKQMKFAVCTVGAGKGDLKVTVADDEGHPLKVTIGDLDPDNKEVTFTPDRPGNHHVTVTWSGQPVPDGEIDVQVEKPLDLSACIIGDLNSHPVVGQPTSFTVDCSRVGSDDLQVTIVDSAGNPINAALDKLGSGSFECSYTATSVQPHKIHVKIAGSHVPSSPLTVLPIDPSKVIVNIDSDKDYKIGEQVEIAVTLTEAGPGQLGINLSAPPGSGTDCQAKEVSPGHMNVVFTPNAAGDHVVNLTFSDNNVPATPVTIKVVPRADVKAVVVSGDGVREGQVGKTAVFTVDTSAAGPGELDVKVRGPRHPIEVQPVEVGDGLYEVNYTPSEEGSHIIAVKYADQHVPGSAFRPQISKSTSSEDVVAYGKGLEEDNLVMTEVDSAEFIVLSDSKSPTADHPSNLDSYSLVDQPPPPPPDPQISIDPADVCADEESTSEEISVLALSGDKSESGATEGTISSIDLVDVESEELEEEQTTPVLAQVVMEEIKAGVEEAKPVVELELDVEPDDGTVEATLEDITEVKAVPTEETPVVALGEVKEVEAEKPSDKDSDVDSDHSSDLGSVSEGSLPEEIVKEAEEEEEEEASPKSKPLRHVISAGVLITALLLLASAGEENLPDRTEVALSSILLAYLLTYAAVDLQLLSSANLTNWLNATFNMVVGPLLFTYLVYTSTVFPNEVALMIPVLGALLVVEASVLVEELEPKSIAQGVVASVAGLFLYNSLKDIGNAQPIVKE